MVGKKCDVEIWKEIRAAIILLAIGITLYLLFVKEESANCTLVVGLDKDVFINEYNFTSEEFERTNSLYDDWRFNVSFKSYQEALAYRELMDGYYQDFHWVKYRFGCDINKTISRASLDGAIKNIVSG